MINMLLVDKKSEAQFRGVDRLIYLANDSILRIDEKKREKSYPDILLEYLSNSEKNSPGWIEKDLAIDFLAYAFMPDKRVYLFPWLLLKRTWRYFREDWIKKSEDNKEGFRIVKADNFYYDTYSIAVPLEILLSKIRCAMIIQLP